jgi:hypothetical protein
MSTPSTAAPRTIETLKAAIAGRVFVPGEAGGYDQGRQAWNLAVGTTGIPGVKLAPSAGPRLMEVADVSMSGTTSADTSPAPGPPGQLVRGRAAAGSYSVHQADQQEQDAWDENRAAGQHDT